ncbi:uncharacterized protein [Dendrobates tinctorius]|uniref:uncharacterized protein n=1 Tax=Dendrobates tinctorius TaxID=92724 RepID=UPI003CC96508
MSAGPAQLHLRTPLEPGDPMGDSGGPKFMTAAGAERRKWSKSRAGHREFTIWQTLNRAEASKSEAKWMNVIPCILRSHRSNAAVPSKALLPWNVREGVESKQGKVQEEGCVNVTDVSGTVKEESKIVDLASEPVSVSIIPTLSTGAKCAGAGSHRCGIPDGGPASRTGTPIKVHGFSVGGGQDTKALMSSATISILSPSYTILPLCKKETRARGTCPVSGPELSGLSPLLSGERVRDRTDLFSRSRGVAKRQQTQRAWKQSVLAGTGSVQQGERSDPSLEYRNCAGLHSCTPAVTSGDSRERSAVTAREQGAVRFVTVSTAHVPHREN